MSKEIPITQYPAVSLRSTYYIVTIVDLVYNQEICIS